jgi:SAM-dependent methyltransferase
VSDWFESWFGEEYIALYPHRDEEEARTVAEMIAQRVGLPRTAHVLDLACGAGRHQRELCDHWWTVGLDLSPALLRVARSEDREAPLVRADMRHLPFGSGKFDMVVNLFTSFGYFRDDQQHRIVLDEVARVTRTGGWFVLDYLNAPQVRETLVPFDRQQMGSRVIDQEREISHDGRYVRKTITLLDEDRTFVERVRLFEPDELEELLTMTGFDVDEVIGSYDGRPLERSSERAIFFARRRA